MAKYKDWHCTECDNDFEFMHHPSDEEAFCPVCEAPQEKLEERYVPRPNQFTLKGKGWFSDGY